MSGMLRWHGVGIKIMRVGLRNGLAVVAVLLVAASAGKARAEHAIDPKTETAIHDLVCSGMNKDAVECQDEYNGFKCPFTLDATYPIVADNKHYIIASYEDECLGHGANFGGSVLILAEGGHPWVLASDNPGDRPREECVTVKDPHGSDGLYCLYFYQEGDVVRLVEHYAVVDGKLVVDILRFQGNKLMAIDDSGEYILGYSRIDCSKLPKNFYISFDNLRIGPYPQSLSWDVVYVDASQVRKRCRMPSSVTKGEKYASFSQKYAGRGRFVYDLRAGSFMRQGHK